MTTYAFAALALLALVSCGHGATVVGAPGRSPRPVVWPMRQVGWTFLDTLLKPYIIGGKSSNSGEFPHQVSLQKNGFYDQHICGGTIIAPLWVLTAAHCVADLERWTSLFILAGKTNLALREEGQQKIYVRDYLIHERYDAMGNVGPYDIALLRLMRPLQYSKTVQPAALPQQGAIPSGSATLSGWGMVNPYDEMSLATQLQKLDLPIIPMEECMDFMTKNMGRVHPLRDTNICVGSLVKSGQGSCMGDSGGPLIQKENDKVVVIGATSWGFDPCAVEPTPSIYTRVSAYVDWIEKQMAHYKP